MRQNLDVTTSGLYLSGEFDLHSRVKIVNGSGTSVDLFGRYSDVTVSFPNPNEPIGSASVEFVRELQKDNGSTSLAPSIRNSSYNKLADGVTFSPLLLLGRVVTIDVALTPRYGARPVNASSFWYEVFNGRIRRVSWPELASNKASIECNGFAGALETVKSESDFVYTAGTAIETVFRQILDNNGFASILTYVPVPTGKVLPNNYAPGIQKSVWSQLWDTARSYGAVAFPRYRGHNPVELTLFTPAREKVVTDMTVTAWDYKQLEIDEEELRNVGHGSIINQNGDHEKVGPVVNVASINTYGGYRRPFWIALNKFSPIRSAPEMLELLEDAVSDVADPDAVASIPSHPLPFIECGEDLYLFPEDPRLFDDGDQVFAPFSSTLTIKGDSQPFSQTEVRGKPTAGSKTWRTFGIGGAFDAIGEELTELRGSLDALDTYIDTVVADNIVSEAERAAVNEHLKQIEVEKEDVEGEYTGLQNSLYLEGIAESNLATAHTVLVGVDGVSGRYGELVTAINNLIADKDVTALERNAFVGAYNNYGVAFGTFRLRTVEAREAVADKVLAQGNSYTDTLKATTDAEIANVNAALTDLDTEVHGAFRDGVISAAEAKAIAEHLKQLGAEYQDVAAQYAILLANPALTGAPASALTTAWGAYDAQANPGPGTATGALVMSINTAIAPDADGVARATAAEAADVQAKFDAYALALADLSEAIQDALDAISINHGPSLDVDVTPGEDNYIIVWAGEEVVTLSIDSGGYLSPPPSPITVTRGSADKVYNFKAVKDGRSTTHSVAIPALPSLPDVVGNKLRLLSQQWAQGGTLDLEVQHGTTTRSVQVFYDYASVAGGADDTSANYSFDVMAGGGIVLHSLEDAIGSLRLWPAGEVPHNLRLTPYAAIGGAAGTGAAGPVLQVSADPEEVPVTLGGTGRTTIPSASLVVGAGTAPVDLIAPGVTGGLLRSNGLRWAWGTLVESDLPGHGHNYLDVEGLPLHNLLFGLGSGSPGVLPPPVSMDQALLSDGGAPYWGSVPGTLPTPGVNDKVLRVVAGAWRSSQLSWIDVGGVDGSVLKWNSVAGAMEWGTLSAADVDAEPIIGTKGSAFNKNFGTLTGTVAQGNHTHSQYEPAYSKTAGALLYAIDAADVGSLPMGTSGRFLKSMGAGVVPVWESISGTVPDASAAKRFLQSGPGTSFGWGQSSYELPAGTIPYLAGMVLRAASTTTTTWGTLSYGDVGAQPANSALNQISPTTSLYGSLNISGTVGGYAGINFPSVSRTLMVRGDYQGIYQDGVGWLWYFLNGALTGGTVPAARISAGTFGAGDYIFPGLVAVDTLRFTDGSALTNIDLRNANTVHKNINSGTGYTPWREAWYDGAQYRYVGITSVGTFLFESNVQSTGSMTAASFADTSNYDLAHVKVSSATPTGTAPDGTLWVVV